MKRKSLLISLSLIAGTLGMVSCGNENQVGEGNISGDYAGGILGGVTIANPWNDVEDIESLGEAIGVDYNFSGLAFKEIENLSATDEIAQINYKDGSSIRIKKGQEAEDISGIYGAVASNYYSFTGANFYKYFEDDLVYACFTNTKYDFCYYGVKGQDEKTVDETVTMIYNLYKLNK